MIILLDNILLTRGGADFITQGEMREPQLAASHSPLGPGTSDNRGCRGHLQPATYIHTHTSCSETCVLTCLPIATQSTTGLCVYPLLYCVIHWSMAVWIVTQGKCISSTPKRAASVQFRTLRGWILYTLKQQTPHVHMVYVRSMALVLWQPPEYYITPVIYTRYRATINY